MIPNEVIWIVTILARAVLAIFGFAFALFVLYVSARLVGFAIARSWFSVKNDARKEGKH